MKDFKMHVVSNTHWDREWLYSFQETRMQLVEVVDKLLNILKEKEDYQYFTFDAQTVVLEDYLEIRQERKEDLKQLIRDGRLLVGPWYSLPEQLSINGECIIRNILTGHQVAQEFGRVMKVGYTPSSIGQCSQLPQIFQGFGIDALLFYRGMIPDLVKSEFLWEGADGSQVLASRMGPYARYNYFFFVFRPVVYGMTWGDRVYKWQDGGLPFHLCGPEEYKSHYFLLCPSEQFNKQAIIPSLKKLAEMESQGATTSCLLGMMGMDSTIPHPREPEIIHLANQKLGRKALLHSNLEKFINDLRGQVCSSGKSSVKALKKWQLLKGEIKYSQTQVYGIRTYLKQANARAENELIHWAEPLNTLVWQLSPAVAYPTAYLKLAWRYLLKNQAHDTIHGCGMDVVHRDGENRCQQVEELASSLQRRAMEQIAKNINLSTDQSDIFLIVFNPLPFKCSEVISAVVEVPQEDKPGDIKVYDHRGKRIPHQTNKTELDESVMRHQNDVTMAFLNKRFFIDLEAKDVPALGYKVLAVKAGKEEKKTKQGSISPAQCIMENKYLKAVINPNGTIDLEDKGSGQIYGNLHYFEDTGDGGTAWDFEPPVSHRPKTTLDEAPEIMQLHNGPLKASYLIKYHWHLPVGLTADKKARSKDLKEVPIQVEVTLRRGAKMLDFKTMVDNTVKDHRLRVLFPTRLIAAETSSAYTPFDVVERPVKSRKITGWHKYPPFPWHPFLKFVDVSDGKLGLAAFSNDIFEYELMDDTERTLALTFFRAFSIRLCTVSYRWESRPEQIGSQSLRCHTFCYSIYPHKGTWQKGEVLRQMQCENLRLKVGQCGVGHKGKLPKAMSFLEIRPAEILLSTLKKSENDNSLILRVYNPTDRAQRATIKFFKRIKRAYLTNFLEKKIEPLKVLGHNTLNVTIEKKKIATIKIYP